MKIAKLLLAGLLLLVLIIPSLACADLMPQAKQSSASMSAPQLSTGNHGSNHYHRFFR